MLIELWERLCGYDKWTETKAFVESSDLRQKGAQYGIGGATPKLGSWIRIAWTDSQGWRRAAEFGADDESPFYQLVGGETVTIRYNPAKPQQYYCRDLLKARVCRLFQALGRALLRRS